MPARPSLPKVTATGSRRASLEALRQILAEAIEGGVRPKALKDVLADRDLAALARRLMVVMQELDELPQPKKKSVVDDIATRRAARNRAAG